MQKGKYFIVFILFMSFIFIVNADTTYRATFENNSIGAWTNGTIDSTNPLNGTYSFQSIFHVVGGFVDSYQAVPIGDIAKGNSSFNVSFKFRHNEAKWTTFGLANQLTAGNKPTAIIELCTQGLANECITGGDSATIGIFNNTGTPDTTRDTGLRCPQSTTGGGCNLTIVVNDSNSGADNIAPFKMCLDNSTHKNFCTPSNSSEAQWYYARGGLQKQNIQALWYLPQSASNTIWFDDIRAWNFSQPVINKVQLQLYTPANETYSSLILQVNLSANTTTSSALANVSIILNGVRNATSTSAYNSTFFLNVTGGMNDGNHSWYIQACDINNTCETTVSRIYVFKNSSPNANIINPNASSVISLSNLTLNISINSTTLNYTNLTVFYSSGAKLYSNLTTERRNLVDFINFSSELNYTINITIKEKTGLEINITRYFFFDASKPNITIDSPTNGGSLSTLSFSLATTITDRSPTTCNYRVTLATNPNDNNPPVPTTSFNCVSSTVTVPSDNTNYTIFVNATDGVYETSVNSSFFLDTTPDVGGGGGSGGGGGGGTGTTITLKPSCNINVNPSPIFIGAGKPIQKITLFNNEDSTYSPTFTFRNVEGKASFKDDLSLTNIPQVIVQKGQVEFGVTYKGTSSLEGYNELVLSSTTCADIVIPISVNIGIVTQIVEDFIDPNKTTKENFITISLSSVSKYLPLFKVWMLFIFNLAIITAISFRRLSSLNRQNKKLSVVIANVVNILIAMTLTLVFSAIIP